MPNPITRDPINELAPVLAGDERGALGKWTGQLIVYLRVVAGLSMTKGLYHWAVICGFVGSSEGFAAQPLPWQTATVFFAVIDLVAAVGLWLAAPWGAVVWLTAAVSMVVVNISFPQVYGQQMLIVMMEGALIAAYLFLAIQSAREHP